MTENKRKHIYIVLNLAAVLFCCFAALYFRTYRIHDFHPFAGFKSSRTIAEQMVQRTLLRTFALKFNKQNPAGSDEQKTLWAQQQLKRLKTEDRENFERAVQSQGSQVLAFAISHTNSWMLPDCSTTIQQCSQDCL